MAPPSGPARRPDGVDLAVDRRRRPARTTTNDRVDRREQLTPFGFTETSDAFGIVEHGLADDLALWLADPLGGPSQPVDGGIVKREGHFDHIDTIPPYHRTCATIRAMAITFHVNGDERTVDVDPDTPLLWVLRDTLGLTGTKFGCGIAECGACTVLMDGKAVRSCMTPIAAAAGAAVTTIEGLSRAGRLHPVQQAWIAHQVPQCGYCQSGMIIAVAAFTRDHPNPTDEEIDAAITNICRCGTFVRVRRAIHAIGRTE